MEIQKTHTVKVTVDDLEKLVGREVSHIAAIKNVHIEKTGNVDNGTYKESLVYIEFDLT